MGCASPAEIPALSRPAPEAGDGVTVYVLTKYELTEVSADFGDYTSWAEMIEAEFDGRSEERGRAEWRGGYVTSIGKLRPNDANKIVIYLNGVYSPYFARGCEYAKGYALAFVERGAEGFFNSQA